MTTADDVLRLLDDCARDLTFLALDNGYFYLAATRLSLHRSSADWAVVIEGFEFSPRAGCPDLWVWTYCSRLPHVRDDVFYPLDEGPWIDEEQVAEEASHVVLRGQRVPLPAPDAYADHGITLEEPPRVAIFELCRYLAGVHRPQVLGTPDERRASVPPGLAEILVLDDWRHPDVIEGELPSDVETFRQLAAVLETGDVTRYRPSEAPNTHWRNWPDGGTL